MINLDYIIVCILGLLIGSYLNGCIYRIPMGEWVWFPLFPCKEKITLQYFIVELLVPTMFIMTYHQYGFSLKGFVAITLVCTVVTASFIDLKHMIIPNSINYFIAITGIIFMLMGWTVDLKESLLGFAVGGGVLLLLGLLSLWMLKKEGMGGGDIKLAAACGIYLGVEKTIFALISTAYIAGIILLLLLAAKRIRKDQYIPFGPFLSAGVVIVILFFN